MNTRAVLFACVWVQAAAICRAADMSPEFTAVVHDVLQLYAGDSVSGVSDTTKKAADILKQAHLMGSNRPATASSELIDKYGKALALGTRTSQFATEIIAVHDAFRSGDKETIRNSIRNLMKRAGRAEPNESALDKMVEDLTEIEGNPRSVERVTMEDADRKIDVSWAKQSGKVKVDVIDKHGTNGQPTRTTFTGETQTKPDPTGKSVAVSGKPDTEKPREVTSDKAKQLREKINGDWIDQERNKWVINGSGSAVTATRTNKDGHKVEFKSSYDLAKLNGEHIINNALDVTEPLPGGVKEQLASKYHPPYKITLDANDAGDKLEGTLTSLHVTYSGLTSNVELIHDPYDMLLVLTRAQKTASSGTALGMKEGDFP